MHSCLVTVCILAGVSGAGRGWQTTWVGLSAKVSLTCIWLYSMYIVCVFCCTKHQLFSLVCLPSCTTCLSSAEQLSLSLSLSVNVSVVFISSLIFSPLCALIICTVNCKSTLILRIALSCCRACFQLPWQLMSGYWCRLDWDIQLLWLWGKQDGRRMLLPCLAHCTTSIWSVEGPPQGIIITAT